MTDVEFVRAVEPMAPNLNAENTTPEVKRKLEDGTCSMHAKKAKVDGAYHQVCERNSADDRSSQRHPPASQNLLRR